jgi:hypothetical protein
MAVTASEEPEVNQLNPLQVRLESAHRSSASQHLDECLNLQQSHQPQHFKVLSQGIPIVAVHSSKTSSFP